MTVRTPTCDRPGFPAVTPFMRGALRATATLALIVGVCAPQLAGADPSRDETEDYVKYVLSRFAARPAREVDDVNGHVYGDGKISFAEVLNDRGREFSYTVRTRDIGWIRARNTERSYTQSGESCDAIRASLICRKDDCVERTYDPGRSASGLRGRVTMDDVKTSDGMNLYFCKADWQEFLRLTRALDHLSGLLDAPGISFVNEVRDMDDIGRAFD